MNVCFLCDACDREVEAVLDDYRVSAKCPHCSQIRELKPNETVVRKNVLDGCPLCGCKVLYTQRDFNRKLGLAIVIVGALFSIITYGISLIVCALIDFLLYRYLPLVTVCYRCQSVYRDSTPNPEHQSYNLHTAELFAASQEK